MNDNSWIKLFRKFKEWEWYQNSNVKDVFLEILLTANFEDRRWQGIEIKRGQLITSVSSLFYSLNKNPKKPDISTHQIRTALDKLKMTNELAIETTSNYTIITVNKYNDYQQVANETANEWQTSGKRVATTKEYKNIRIKEYINYKDIDYKIISEIANKYSISENTVKDKLEEIRLWEEEKPGRMKGRNWKATLMNWIRRDIENGKIKKISIKIEPNIIEQSPEEKAKALQKLEEVKNNNPLFVEKFYANTKPAMDQKRQ